MKFPSSKNYAAMLISIIALSLGNAVLPNFAKAKQNDSAKVIRNKAGVTVQTAAGLTRVEIWNEHTVRVRHSAAQTLPASASMVVISRPQRTKWQFKDDANDVLIVTPKLQVRIDKADGTVHFADGQGAAILDEATNGAALANRVTQSFELGNGEAIYGLGQHQAGVMDYVGTRVHLQQENREVAVPVLLSSKGYALLWDNAAITDVDVGKTDPNKLTWSSEVGDAVDYYFLYGPKPDQAIAAYRALTGEAPMFGKWAWGFWQCREHYESQKELLGVAAWYRDHHVPLDGVIQDWQYWTPHPWGSHQFDTNRYPDPAKMMRTLHAENVHAIISVWPKFDLHSANADELRAAGGLYPQILPSVYPKGSNQWYDAFNPVARKIYWRQISDELFSLGFDGWWLDASEPELSGHWGEFRNFKTAAGSGAKVFNAYPLMHTTAVYQGQRAETSAKRVFILTRSAYAGQQRNAAVTWSGDIHGNWSVFARQIPGGLNFVASGIPYWNTDTGGFFGGDPADPKYAELFTRWFQFSAFCPMFRVHGSGKPKEIWRFDKDTQKILIAYDRLRYHLMPYIYSVSWKVTSEGYTMMRPLVMDFQCDTNVFHIADEFMFGPAILVNPVIKRGATHRRVYLPAGTKWFDFWTGKNEDGGQTITADAPIETMPLFVRAGSIIPFGPSIEYAMEKSDPIELRVYRGANGSFTLYEDEGDNYNYEHGKFSTIPIIWNEATRMLEIGKRSGKFPGMLKKRTFRIVWVSPHHGTGIQSTENADTVATYRGYALKIRAGK
ncbi:MAG: TIM-barrel domain-containing protein [Limisphaerales bacterium]